MFTVLGRKKSFTLVEFLVAIIVASILILIVGVISTTAIRSFENTRREDAVFSEVFSALDIMQSRIRRANQVQIVNWAGWPSQVLVTTVPDDPTHNTTSAFTVFEADGQRNFVFFPVINDPFTPPDIAQAEELINGAQALTFIPDVVADPLIRVNIYGIKDDVPFFDAAQQLINEAMRRN